MPTALITGASRGLGFVLTTALAERGWRIFADARNAGELHGAFPGSRQVTQVPGDVTDPAHRAELFDEVRRAGRLDLLVNNASDLGVSPLPPLAAYPLDRLRAVLETNVIAPLALIQGTIDVLNASAGAVVNLGSDAGVEAYEGWGGYGLSKAALDQLSHVLGAEQAGIRVYAFDPGDMRTQMHQAAYPGEDISDRPEPKTVVPALIHLIESRPSSGRYRASDLLAAAGTAR